MAAPSYPASYPAEKYAAPVAQFEPAGESTTEAWGDGPSPAAGGAAPAVVAYNPDLHSSTQTTSAGLVGKKLLYGCALSLCGVCLLFYIGAAAANAATSVTGTGSFSDDDTPFTFTIERDFGFYAVCTTSAGQGRTCDSYSSGSDGTDECDAPDNLCEKRRAAAAFVVFAILASFAACGGGVLALVGDQMGLPEKAGPLLLAAGSFAASFSAMVAFAAWTGVQDTLEDTFGGGLGLDVSYGPSFGLVVTGFLFNGIAGVLAAAGAFAM